MPPTRCHIVAISPRTGTTLLAESMRACYAIDGFEEHEARVTRLRRDVDVYLTKWPGDVRAVEPRLRLDRSFHVICLMRDPRDVIVSRHANDPTRYWVSLRVWLERLAYVRRLERHERFSVLRYEDMVESLERTQDWLEERIPALERTGELSSFHARAAPSADSLKALGDLREIDTSSIGTWREHLPRVAGQIALHGSITDQLIELGYETDDAWMRQLAEVEPDLSPSRVGESPRPRWRRPAQSEVVVPWASAAAVRAGRLVGLRLV